MKRITYDKGLDDDDWRDTNFSDAEIIAAKSMNARQPTADELIKAAKRFGPEGILESAILLSQFHYKKVADALTRMKEGK